MLQAQEYGFKGMDRDTSKSKRDPGFYWEAINKRIILSEDSSDNGNLVDEKGLELFLQLPQLTLKKINDYTRVTFFDPKGNQNRQYNVYNKSFVGVESVPGNELSFDQHTILNVSSSGNNLVIFTLTNADNTHRDRYPIGVIWVMTYNESNDSYEMNSLFIDDNTTTKWDLNYPIETLCNIESESINKVYFIDTINQMRFVNILDPESVYYDITKIEMLPHAPSSEIDLINFTSGGFYKAGVVQYCYNYYNIHGSQSKISPITPLVYLGDNLAASPKGGAVNEYSSSAVMLQILNVNQLYDRIKVYALYRSSIEQTPEVRIIYDDYIDSTTINITDTGSAAISAITLSELLYAGGEYIIPKTINTKDGYLFFSNYKFDQIKFPDFKSDGGVLDLRCVQFDNTGNYIVVDSNGIATNESNTVDSITDIPTTHDFINPDFYHSDGIRNPLNTADGYDNGIDNLACKYKYQSDGVTLGGSGIYMDYSFELKERTLETRLMLPVNSTGASPNDTSPCTHESIASKVKAYEYLSVKTGEIYRIALEARDIYGRTTDAKWIADIKVPEMYDFDPDTSHPERLLFGKLFQSSDLGLQKIQSIYLKIQLNIEPIVAAFAAQGVEIVGFRILRAKRTNDDKSIIGQGLLNTSIFEPNAYRGKKVKGMLDYFQRYRAEKASNVGSFFSTSFESMSPMHKSEHGVSLVPTAAGEVAVSTDGVAQYLEGQYGSIISPDFLDEKNISQIDELYSVYTLQLYNTLSSITQVNRTSKTALSTYNYDSVQTGFATIGTAFKQTHFAGRCQSGFGTSQFNYIIDGRTTGSPYESIDYYTAYNQAYTGYGNDTGINGLNGASSYPQRVGMLNIDWLNGIDAKPLNLKSGEWYRPRVNFGFLATGGVAASISNIAVPHIGVYFGYNQVVSSADVLSPLTEVDLGDNANLMAFTDTEDSKLYGTLCEVRKRLYGQYGGFTHNAKVKSIYIPYSRFILNTLATANILTLDCFKGDTFVTLYRNIRHWPDAANLNHFMHEIISFPVESYINLDLRNDNSFMRTEYFNNTLDDAYKMNTVYNQEDNVITNTGLLEYEINNEYLVNVIPSKHKTYGELIDNWTDIQLSEEYTLEGIYGAVESLVKAQNEIYAFQQKGIAKLIINPRVAINTSDGAPIEISSGIASGAPIIQQHIYIDIKNGCQNKFSIQSVDSGIVFVNLLNKSLMLCAGGESINISQESLMSSYFNDVLLYSNHSMKHQLIDVPKGVVSFYDNKRKEYYLTLFGNGSNITIVYSFRIKSFTHKLSYTPISYISFYDKIYSTKPNYYSDNVFGTSLISKYHIYEMWKNINVCVFFHDESLYIPSQLPHQSSITYLSSPVIEKDKLFTNCIFDMEAYDNGNIDIPTKTFDYIKVWNEYQPGVDTLLINGKNINRKFRKWKCQIPRMAPSLNKNAVRMGTQWVFVKFYSSNVFTYPSVNPTGNYKLSLHNMNIIYNI